MSSDIVSASSIPQCVSRTPLGQPSAGPPPRSQAGQAPFGIQKSKADNSSILFDKGGGQKSLREYQQKILERCKKENTLVCLETNMGKTLIAVKAAEYFHNLLPKKVIVFLVPTVVLARQQASEFCDNCNLDVRCFTGGSSFPGWRISRLSDVICMTAQVFLNELEKDESILQTVSMIVFDEVHHAEKKHPFHLVAKKCSKNSGISPHILGLTASLGPGETLGESILRCLKISRTCCSRICTADTSFLLQKPSMEEFVVQMSRDSYSFYNKLLYDSRHILSNFSDCFVETYELDAYEKQFKQATELERTVFKILNSAVMILDYISPSKALNFIESEQLKNEETSSFLRGIIEFASSLNFRPEEKSAKFSLLLEILHLFHNKRESRTLLLVTSRLGAKMLRDEIKQFGFSVEILLGHASDIGLTSSQQEKVRTAFAEGKFEVLVATSVAEEGLNIPNCDLVIRYDRITSTTSLIQSKGRARKNNSKYFIILHDYSNSNFLRLNQSEKKLKDAITILDKLDINTMTLEELWNQIFSMVEDRKADSESLLNRYLLNPKNAVLGIHLKMFGKQLEIRTKKQGGFLFCCKILFGNQIFWGSGSPSVEAEVNACCSILHWLAQKDLLPAELGLADSETSTEVCPPKNLLQSLCQRNRYCLPVYNTEQNSFNSLWSSSLSVMQSDYSTPMFFSSGCHSRKKEAENAVALEAYNYLQQASKGNKECTVPTKQYTAATEDFDVNPQLAKNLLIHNETISNRKIQVSFKIVPSESGFSCEAKVSAGDEKIVLNAGPCQKKKDAEKQVCIKVCRWLHSQALLEVPKAFRNNPSSSAPLEQSNNKVRLAEIQKNSSASTLDFLVPFVNAKNILLYNYQTKRIMLSNFDTKPTNGMFESSVRVSVSNQGSRYQEMNCTSELKSNKASAEKEAAFIACRWLHQIGILEIPAKLANIPDPCVDAPAPPIK